MSNATTEKMVRSQHTLSTDFGDGEGVLMDIEKGCYFGLSHVASYIWQLYETPHSSDEIVDALCRRYRVARETCQTESASFITALLERGLLTKAS